jgi:hypothetical protein
VLDAPARYQAIIRPSVPTTAVGSADAPGMAVTGKKAPVVAFQHYAGSC